MLPKYLEIDPEENSTIQIRKEQCQYFENGSHFHSDLELNLILKSTGLRFVGDSILGFNEGDLVLLGPNVPHSWKNDQTYYDHGDETNAQAIVIRFPELFMGKDQYLLPEMKLVRHLFENSGRGLLITGGGKERIVSSIKKMLHYRGMERMIIFLGILNAISNTCEYTILSSGGFMSSLNKKNENRLNKVYDFMTSNFKEKITLAEIAEKINMNPSAFSRFFSQYTGKSVTGFLQEIRLGYTCNLLQKSNRNISEIMYESGFQNQAYFNKLFVDRIGLTPNEYRKR